MGKRGRKAEYVRDPRTRDPVTGLYRRQTATGYDFYHFDDRGRVRRCGNSGDIRGAIAEYRRRQALQDDGFVTVEAERPSVIPELVEPVQIVDKLQGRTFWRYDLPADAFAETLKDILAQPDGPDRLADLTGVEAFKTIRTARLPVAPVTMAEIEAVYQDTKTFTDADEMTRSRAVWREFVASIGTPRTLAEVTNADLACYFTFLSDKFAAKTRKNRIHKINSILNHAAAHMKEHRATIEDFKIEMRKVKQTVRGTTGKALKEKHDPTPIQPAEFAKLVGAASKKWNALLLTALNMGLHASEAGMLAIQDFDLENGTYRSERTKSGEIRAAVLWKRTIKAIRAYRKSKEYRQAKDGHLFLNEDADNETPMTRWNVNDGLKSLRKRAKLTKKLTFDSLRDATETFGSIGNDSGAVDILMAHSLSGTNAAAHYRYRLPEHTANVVATLEARFFRNDR